MASFFTTEAFKEFVLQSKNKSAEDWELYVKTAEFVVYRQKAPGDRNPNLYKYRSIGGWKDIQPETLAHVYLDLAFRSTWDKNMKSHQSFVTDLMQSGNHFEMKYPWPLTNRDYAYTIERRIVKDSEKNEYQVILGESLPDTCFPAVKGVIRIDTYMQNICIGPVKQGQGCTVFMDYFDDPKVSCMRRHGDFYHSNQTSRGIFPLPPLTGQRKPVFPTLSRV